MLFLKQCAGVLAAPLTMALLIAIAAVAFRLCGRRRIAIGLFVTASAVAYLASIGLVSDVLLGPLERQYSAMRENQSVPVAGWIVVLGSDYSPRDGIPVSAALDADGLARIVEGVRLARKYGGMRVFVSGGAHAGRASPAQGYAEMARALGVNSDSLVVSDQPLDTNSEARAVVKLLGEAPFILVTSAYHMPRAMRLMERAGARPIPAPAGQLVNDSVGAGWRQFLPNSGSLRKTERALHEYLGNLAMTLSIN